jgi:hypothetical protein
MKYLYFISRTDDVDYRDEYDSAVVCARTEREAKGTKVGYAPLADMKNIDVELLGLADDHIEIGEICSSFNAG